MHLGMGITAWVMFSRFLDTDLVKSMNLPIAVFALNIVSSSMHSFIAVLARTIGFRYTRLARAVAYCKEVEHLLPELQDYKSTIIQRSIFGLLITAFVVRSIT